MGDKRSTRIIRLARRDFFGAATSAFVVARLGVGCDGEGATAFTSRDVAPRPVSEPLAPLTPNDLFYTVSASGPPPEGWDEAWQLSLLGLGLEGGLTLAEVKAAAPHETFEHTLECIGNAPPGRAIGNAMWTGVRLAGLLEGLGLQVPDEAAWLVMRCGDGYSTYLPVEDIDAGLALVWQMNGEPLPVAHGAPLRMLTPGRYGMKNPKWLLEIEWLVDKPEGFWESFGWSEEARYKVHSWFVEPEAGVITDTAGVTLLGSAHAGSATITRVEISLDEGETWREAELTYSGPPNAWSLWRYHWVPEASGSYALSVRAHADDGRIQAVNDREGAGALSGYPGLHYLRVEVS